MAGNIVTLTRDAHPGDVVRRHNARHGVTTSSRCSICKTHGTAYVSLTTPACRLCGSLTPHHFELRAGQSLPATFHPCPSA